jgi:hypothetical protein
MLDALNRRYAAQTQGGDRFVRAEHPRNGTGFYGWDPDAPERRNIGPLRTADFVAIDTWESKGHQIYGHEVKVSRSDWLHELADPDKAHAWKRYCHRWFLAVPDAEIVKPGELPEGWGLIVLGASGIFRAKHRAPLLTPEPLPFPIQIGLMRAVAKTAARNARGEA